MKCYYSEEEDIKMQIINFEQNIKDEAEIINGFTSPNDPYGGAEVVYKDHTKLKKLIGEETIEKEKRIGIIEQYLMNYYHDVENEYEKSLNEIKESWYKIETPLLKRLYEIFQEDFNNPIKAIAQVNSLSIYPRDIEQKTFSVGYKQKIFEACRTCLHEYTHFLYFKKWKELFPKDMPKAECKTGPLWQLSEILAVVINCDRDILRILPDADNQTFFFNDRSYYNTQAPSTNYSIIGYFKKKYIKHIDSKKDISIFLKECREEFLIMAQTLNL